VIPIRNPLKLFKAKAIGLFTKRKDVDAKSEENGDSEEKLARVSKSSQGFNIFKSSADAS